MKAILLRVLMMMLLTGSSSGRCLNHLHVKGQDDQNARNEGRLVKTSQYNCLVKRSERQNFDDHNLCKGCGCHVSDHSDTDN